MDDEPSVEVAASIFREFCYKNRDSLTAGIICAGYDKKKGGQVFSIPLGGLVLRRPFAIGGMSHTSVCALALRSMALRSMVLL